MKGSKMQLPEKYVVVVDKAVKLAQEFLQENKAIDTLFLFGKSEDPQKCFAFWPNPVEMQFKDEIAQGLKNKVREQNSNFFLLLMPSIITDFNTNTKYEGLMFVLETLEGFYSASIPRKKSEMTKPIEKPSDYHFSTEWKGRFMNMLAND